MRHITKRILIGSSISLPIIVSPFTASCGKNELCSTTWNSGSDFKATIPPKEFIEGQGTFFDNNALTSAYHEELNKQPLIIGEDWIGDKFSNPNISSLCFQLLEISALKTHYTTPWDLEYFTLTFNLKVTGIYKDIKLENRSFQFKNFPFYLKGDHFNEPIISPVADLLTEGDNWSVFMPEMYVVGQDDIHFTYRDAFYNSKVINESSQWLSDAIELVLTDITTFQSTYFKNAKL